MPNLYFKVRTYKTHKVDYKMIVKIKLVQLFTLTSLNFSLFNAENLVSKNNPSCIWVAGNYGSKVFCNKNFIQTGLCSSGEYPDCDGGKYFYMARCCEVISDDESISQPTSVENCSRKSGSYGEIISCQSQEDTSKIAHGGCGSGSEADCNNTDVEGWNELECCEKPGLDIHENRCYKKYGGYGEKVVCDGTKKLL